MDGKKTPVTVTAPNGEVTLNLDLGAMSDDFELVELLRAAQQDGAAMVDVYRRVYGADYALAKEACRDGSGKVSSEAMADLFEAVTAKVAALKN